MKSLQNSQKRFQQQICINCESVHRNVLLSGLRGCVTDATGRAQKKIIEKAKALRADCLSVFLQLIEKREDSYICNGVC